MSHSFAGCLSSLTLIFYPWSLLHTCACPHVHIHNLYQTAMPVRNQIWGDHRGDSGAWELLYIGFLSSKKGGKDLNIQQQPRQREAHILPCSRLRISRKRASWPVRFEPRACPVDPLTGHEEDMTDTVIMTNNILLSIWYRPIDRQVPGMPCIIQFSQHS